MLSTGTGTGMEHQLHTATATLDMGTKAAMVLAMHPAMAWLAPGMAAVTATEVITDRPVSALVAAPITREALRQPCLMDWAVAIPITAITRKHCLAFSFALGSNHAQVLDFLDRRS